MLNSFIIRQKALKKAQKKESISFILYSFINFYVIL